MFPTCLSLPDQHPIQKCGKQSAVVTQSSPIWGVSSPNSKKVTLSEITGQYSHDTQSPNVFQTSGVSPIGFTCLSFARYAPRYTSRFNQTSPLATDRPVSKNWAVPYFSVVHLNTQLLKICDNQNWGGTIFPVRCLWLQQLLLILKKCLYGSITLELCILSYWHFPSSFPQPLWPEIYSQTAV